MRKNLILFFSGIFFGIFFSLAFNLLQKSLENYFFAQISKPFENFSTINLEKKPKKAPPEIEAKAAISIKINELKKEKVLFAKNEKEIFPIASLTKLITALVVLEDPENYNLDKEIVISKEAANQANVPEYGNLKEGEKKTVKELLNLILNFSSNDAAFALAQEIGIENFVERMNFKVKELELNNTHFSNPTGLDPENLKWSKENKDYFNYSSAEELAKIGKYILEKFPFVFDFSNKNIKIQLLENQKLIGAKTGYTLEAGGCMFLIFSDDKENYFVNIILGTKTKEERFFEMQKLINWINS